MTARIVLKKRSKYKAVPTIVDSILFHSQKEAKRYQQLKIAEAAGDIKALETQPPFAIFMGRKYIATYKADFRYIEDGKTIIEDCKGVRTPVYRLKKKLVEAQYGIKIRET